MPSTKFLYASLTLVVLLTSGCSSLPASRASQSPSPATVNTADAATESASKPAVTTPAATDTASSSDQPAASGLSGDATAGGNSDDKSAADNADSADATGDDQSADPFASDDSDNQSDDESNVDLTDTSTSDDQPVSIWDDFRRYTLLDLSVDNDRVKQQREWYLRNTEYMNRVLDRAEPYLYYVQTQLDKRGLPSELLLLPIVESAYDPFAYSHGRAAGMWQFIPGTARLLGLKQSWWYEGRRDIVASTNAALNYLDNLQKRFHGDWLLALAAYNAGAGNIQRAIDHNKRRGKPTDFWSLDLRPETSAYVPKLIALAQIFKYPDRYHFHLRDVPFEPYFAIVNVKSQIDLAQAANMAGISIKELYQLNPAFNRWATDPNGPFRLLVPVAQAEQFKLELENLPPEKRVHWQRYTIRQGDSVLSLTKRFHITPELLRSVNSMHGNLLRAGHTLLIPQSSQPLTSYALSADQRLRSKLTRHVPGKRKIIHTVASGESLWQISRKYHVNLYALARWNGMAPRDGLAAGRKIVIWKQGPVTLASNSFLARNRVRKIHYRARSGDSYAGIADKFNVSLHQLKRWNKVDLKKYLQPGDLLTLYVDVTNAP